MVLEGWIVDLGVLGYRVDRAFLVHFDCLTGHAVQEVTHRHCFHIGLTLAHVEELIGEDG